MIRSSERWEGQAVNGRFLLGRALGGSDSSTVFLVDKDASIPTPTIIRLVEASSPAAHDQLAHWQAASKLIHPNLIRIFETGRCQVSGNDLFYVVGEYAEENLAQIIPERALTAEEARQVLEDVLAALSYIHGQGLVHGSLKPSNILAVGDTVKVSSDSLRPVGKSLAGRRANSVYDAPEAAAETVGPPADVWSLGVTLAQALTQHLPVRDSQQANQPTLPQGIPGPFQEIVENCLQVDPARRWTVVQIRDRLQRAKPGAGAVTGSTASAETKPAHSSSSTAAGKKESRKWPYAIALLVAAVLAVILFARPKPPAPEPPPAQPVSEPKPAAGQPTAGGTHHAASLLAGAGSAKDCCNGRVAQRVLPQISAGAQRTIQGKIRVQVEVHVDEAGNVNEARLKSAGPSRYFASKSLDAAKQWKFKPPVEDGQAVASRWLVKFMISRRAIDESAEQVRP